MIPIRDTAPTLTKPVVVKAIVALNIVVFLYEVSLGQQVSGFLMTFGLIPARYFYLAHTGQAGFLARTYPIFTSMFLHGGWLHIIFNMLFLWIFGDNLEDRLGHLRFVVFYLACGAAGAYAQTYLNPASNLPMIGASGAIAGIMGGYLLLFPKARILTLVPIFYFIQVVELPAFLFLGFWFLIQFASGTAGLMGASKVRGGTAWWAHIGGFALGMLLVKVLDRGKRKSQWLTNTLAGENYGTAVDDAVGGKPGQSGWGGGSSDIGLPGL